MVGSGKTHDSGWWESCQSQWPQANYQGWHKCETSFHFRILFNKLNDNEYVVQLPLSESMDERSSTLLLSTRVWMTFKSLMWRKWAWSYQYSLLPVAPRDVWEIIKQTGIPSLGANMVGHGPVKTCQNSLWVIVAQRRARKHPGVDVLIWYHTQEFLKSNLRITWPLGWFSVCHKYSKFHHRRHGQGSSSHSH